MRNNSHSWNWINICWSNTKYRCIKCSCFKSNTTGSAATLTTANIAGVSFDSSSNIDIALENLSNVNALTHNDMTATAAATASSTAFIAAAAGAGINILIWKV